MFLWLLFWYPCRWLLFNLWIRFLLLYFVFRAGGRVNFYLLFTFLKVRLYMGHILAGVFISLIFSWLFRKILWDWIIVIAKGQRNIFPEIIVFVRNVAIDCPYFDVNVSWTNFGKQCSLWFKLHSLSKVLSKAQRMQESWNVSLNLVIHEEVLSFLWRILSLSGEVYLLRSKLVNLMLKS